MKRAATIIFIMTAAASAAMPVSAQETDTMTVVLPDSVKAAAPSSGGLLAAQEASPSQDLPAEADSTQPPWVMPVWKIRYEASESAYRLGTSMSLTYRPLGGWRGSSEISLAKREYRGRDMSDINQKFNNTAIKIVPELYNITLALGQDYLRQKAVGFARSGGDMVIENKFFNGGFQWDRTELRARKSRFAVMGRAGGGQNDFKYDTNLQANASGYLWYGLGDDIDFSGGYGIWRRLEDSDVSGNMFENMTSNMDTISAKAGYGRGDVKLLSVGYKRTMGVVRKVDPPRGNSLEIIENPDLAQVEKSSMTAEKITMKSRLEPATYLALDFEFLRDFYDQQNVIDDRLSKKTELNKLKGKAVYKYATRGRFDFEIDRRENDVDFGPQSLSSYSESEQGIRAALFQSLSDSVKVSIKGMGSLKQRFYKKKDANPRDADYLFYSLLADLDARLPLNIITGVKFTYKQYQTINIDPSLSGDNRVDYTYWVSPRFTLKPTTWFEIGQEYEIKMEFTEFTFKQDDNYLDRTTIMNTNAKFRFLDCNLGIRHRYQFIDTGSYLEPPDGGERLYGPTSESYDQRMDFRLDYMPVPDFTIFSYSNYRFQENNRLGDVDGSLGIVSSSFYDSGEMMLGASRTTKVTSHGKFDFNIAWVKRFGPNLTPERREFWNIDMNVEINF